MSDGEYQIENFYDHVDNEDDVDRSYPNEKKMKIQLAALLLLVGPSGSGKSNILMNIIKGVGIWDGIVLCAKNTDEKLYQHLIKICRDAELKNNMHGFLRVINKIEDLPPVSDYDASKNWLVIIDDMICEKEKLLTQYVEPYYIMGRKNGITTAFLTQSYISAPILIRRQANYIIVKRLNTTLELTKIAKEYEMGISKQQLISLYETATDGDQSKFFMIDLKSSDPSIRFRRNFTPFRLN